MPRAERPYDLIEPLEALFSRRYSAAKVKELACTISSLLFARYVFLSEVFEYLRLSLGMG